MALASMRPAICAEPPSASIVIFPAVGPLAVTTLSFSSVTSFFARSRISPFSPRTTLFAEIVPLLLIPPANVPILIKPNEDSAPPTTMPSPMKKSK